MILWAMSFGTWTCARPGCDSKVEWEDAFVIDAKK